MIGNSRLFEAVTALVNGQGDARSRVVTAMQIISVLQEKDFQQTPDLWTRISKLRRQTQTCPPMRHAGVGPILRDSFTTTAQNRQNRTYTKYSNEIFEIWRATCN